MDFLYRHEAAEALGAIGEKKSIAELEKYAEHAIREIRETCSLAIDNIKFYNNVDSDELKPSKSFHSVDPAPPLAEKHVNTLKETFLDANQSLFLRYRAMFALRNKQTERSVLALVEGLNDDSALFKHEVCYVLGQMAHPAAVPALTKILRKKDEHAMVRHEAAEALGK